MKPPENDFPKIDTLIEMAIDGSITPEQCQHLNDLIVSHAAVRRHYCEYIQLNVNIERLIRTADIADFLEYENILDQELWDKLAFEEQKAPAVVVEREKPKPELIQKVVYPPREKRKISKFVIFTLLNAAAVVLFFLVLRAVPPKGGLEVAALSDSLNAQWANKNVSFQKGDRLATGQTMALSAGLVEVLFDNGARVVLEAPAEFNFLAEDRIGLTYGKAYATVPKQTIGFSVYTPIAKIIVMGTEFGVEADSRGDTQLHVIEGKTALLAGQNENAVNVEVGMGQARNVSGSTQIVTEISLRRKHFVRTFDSANHFVWRGQKTIDLADIVRAGDGLGTGNSEVRLNYLKGFTTDHRGGETRIAQGYLPIEDHPFIDGIFIPDERTVVSSRGDEFERFLRTSGVHCADLLANPPPGLFVVDGRRLTIQFNGKEYSDRGNPCIVMRHSNHGITFDLDAIREHYNLRIDRFTSQVGLIEFDSKRCNANFYVLVDGRLRYSLLEYSEKGVLNDVSVKLEDADRFLTLATSENVDQRDYMAYSTLYENWCVFTEPVLVLERVDGVRD